MEKSIKDSKSFEYFILVALKKAGGLDINLMI